jgi:uncharacterized RDD family membrane protein YckC
MTGLTHPAAGHSGPQLDNRRVLAAAIDVLLLVPVAVLMAKLTDGFDRTSAALTVAWALFYYFALESGGGQTVGKRLLRLRVVRSDGSEPGLREVAVRTVLRTVDGLFGYLVGLGVMLATGQRRQRLGDLAAGTVVASADAERVPSTPTAAVDEAPAVEEEENGVPVVEPHDEAPAVAEDDPAPTIEVPQPALAEPETVEPEPAEPELTEPELDEPELEEDEPHVNEPVAAAPTADDVPEPEPQPVPTAPLASVEPEPADEEATSMGTGVEIVSAIDLIMAEARESAGEAQPAQDDGAKPAEDAGDEPAAP